MANGSQQLEVLGDGFKANIGMNMILLKWDAKVNNKVVAYFVSIK